MHGDVDVFVDGGSNQKSTEFLIIRGKIGPSAAERDTERATSNDHYGIQMEEAKTQPLRKLYSAGSGKTNIDAPVMATGSSIPRPAEWVSIGREREAWLEKLRHRHAQFARVAVLQRTIHKVHIGLVVGREVFLDADCGCCVHARPV